MHILAARGRIVLDPVAPFCITSCSGMAAKLLSTSSSRLAGRRLRAIARPAEVAKLEQAARAALEPHQRAYLNIATDSGHVHVVIQLCESTAGHLQIEVLLFLAEQARDPCLEEIVLDNIWSQAKSSSESDSPDNFRDLVMSQVGSDDDEVFTGLGTDWASAELIGKLDNLHVSSGTPLATCSSSD